MNGVRRLLGGGRAPSPPVTNTEPQVPPPPLKTTAPLVISGKPTWPPSPLSQSSQSPTQRDTTPAGSPATATGPSFSHREKPTRSSIDEDLRRQSLGASPQRKPPPSSATGTVAGPSSPRTPLTANRVAELSRKSIKPLDTTWKRSSAFVDTRDQLLMSLLASEAVVDSREFEILSSEEVEELKKEHQVLSARLGATTKKLTLETKIRDAAVSLSKVNAAHKTLSKQTSEQLEAANRKVEVAQKELWKVSERANEIHRKLLEHRAGVLSASLRNLEAKAVGDTDESGYTTPFKSSEMSPTSSLTSTSSFRGKFEGPHLFAGHVDAVSPMPSRKPLSAPEVLALEEKLREATGRLEVATKEQVEMHRELSQLRMEKTDLEKSLAFELRNKQDALRAMQEGMHQHEDLELQLNQILVEKVEWEQQRLELEDKRREVEMLERRLEVMEERSGEVHGENQGELARRDEEVSILKSQRDADRATWERQRIELEREKLTLGRSQQEADGRWDQERESLRETQQQSQAGLTALQELMQTHGVVHTSRDASTAAMVASLGAHLQELVSRQESQSRQRDDWEARRRALEEDARIGLDKREALNRELEDARREREDARKEVRILETRIRDQSDRFSELATLRSPISSAADSNPDFAMLVAILKPIWIALPSPEARASKFGSARKVNSPTLGPRSPSMNPMATSLSDVDVRSLKTLYDNRLSSSIPENLSAFSVEAFAARVQALIADDRALIERLLRFAQAHDLLKKNAERAQKLAQESSLALETYQKQVKALEERNIILASNQALLQDELHQLQESVDRIMAEKQQVEMQAAEQAETCRQLTEANNALSAKALHLAAEAADAPEAVKRQLEGQLSECKAALEKAQEEINAMRTSEQSQQMALLDELNHMQTENGNLRAQLRALAKK